MLRRLVLLALLGTHAASPEAQSAPVATYTLHAPNALRDGTGQLFNWTVAPDGSIIVSFGQSDGQWSVRRITGWETPAAKEQTVSFPDDSPKRYFAGFGEPLIDPIGKYLVIRPGYHIKLDASGKERREAVIAVIDLITFQLISNSAREGSIAYGDLFFSEQGTLMLTTMKYTSPFVYQTTALALPSLSPVALCGYNLQFPQQPSRATVTTVSETCATFKSASHLADIQELSPRPFLDSSPLANAGSGCDLENISKSHRLALYRCGSDHLTDEDGLFGITFWRNLKVLSIPEGKTILSLRLHFYDGKSSGLFAQANGQDYLIVRHGLKLQTYRLP